MTSPKFSVLLPSKERPELLMYAIDSVRRQSFHDFEIIVSDNASSTPYAELIDPLNDPRIRCVRFERAVPVTENWNHALSHAVGDYVVMLGDDDALAPGYFEAMAHTIGQFAEPDAIHGAAYHYCYPNVIPADPEGCLAIVLNSPLFIDRFEPYLLDHEQAVSLAKKAMHFHHYFPFNSQDFLWRRASMGRLSKGGEFFKSPYPDFYTAIMTFLNADRIVVNPRPNIVIGVSPKSFGYYFHNGQEAAGSAFLGHPQAAALLDDPDALPGPEHNTKWLLAAKEVASSMAGAPELGLSVGVKNYRRLQIVDAVREAVTGANPQPLDQLRPRLRPDEWVLARGLEAGLRAARWRRPNSRGAYILSKVDRMLDQHFPASVTRLPIGAHRCILDALSWLDGTSLGIADAASGATAGPGSLNPYLSVGQQRVVDAFHDLYYSLLNEGRGVDTNRLSWLGTELFKCPMDLWLYQELIAGNRPDVIIETGTYRGGSAHYLATMCELVGHGEVVSIDVNPWSDRPRPRHDRLSYLTGSSVDAAMLADVRRMVGGRSNVLVILDSDHSLSHVLAELRLYQQFVPVGGLMVVEDTNVNGHPTFRDHGPGPWEAVDAFLNENRDFIADRGLERFLLTMNPRGYLRRVARSAASQG